MAPIWQARRLAAGAGLGIAAIVALCGGSVVGQDGDGKRKVWGTAGTRGWATSLVQCEAAADMQRPQFATPFTEGSGPGLDVTGAKARFMPHEIMKYGYPGFDNIKRREGHVLSYDRRHRTAHWVAERLTKAALDEKNADRGEHEFYEDASEPPPFRATLGDYRRSGYDRGHLAAAGNHKYSSQALNDTFSLSNMSPQVGKGFNRGIWNNLETYVRSLAKAWDNVYVITGPLYMANVFENGKRYVKYEVIGPNDVAVPTHFFKALLLEKDNGKRIQIEAYIIPNAPFPDGTSLVQFRVPLEKVEKAAGLLLFDQLGPNRYANCVK